MAKEYLPSHIFRRIIRWCERMEESIGEDDYDQSELIEVLDSFTEWWFDYRFGPRPRKAVAARLTITPTQGETMPGAITVDTTDESVNFEWLDDKGDTNAAAPSNASGAAVPSFTSDNTAVVTVGTGNPAPVTPVGEGTANIGLVPLAYPDGTPVLEADGVTPFSVPSPVQVTVAAGPAVAGALTLSV